MTSLGKKPDSTRASGLDHALPGDYVDLIRDGHPTGNYNEVFGALVSIAMSAFRRGWTESEYIIEISNVGVNAKLWMQVLRFRPRDGKARRSQQAGIRELRKAWSQAVANCNNVGIRSREELRDEAVERAFQWTDRLVDNPDNLTDAEQAVMRYVVSETERRGRLRVTCPGRAVAEYAKLSHRTAARILDRLFQRGLLDKRSSGRPQGRDGSPGKAATFSLIDPADLAHIHPVGIPMCQPQPLFRYRLFASAQPNETALARRIHVLRAWHRCGGTQNKRQVVPA
ncbi:hypothetical protein [Mycolicibacterium austroafricanum]|uniref:hypothetical protein n=1 Tax=Mycolicibacterium austroafricanum TaxID=39687 RepID=UPI001CA342F1|nr:hypothetical protein [Mycolicibacterium austroafricanum]QZT64452.1 hypothetical protein JN085_09060 [Mycolicibacterium austroafricanum]